MKTRHMVGLAMLAGTLVGASVMQALHAQAKPQVYYIAEIDVSNPEAYLKEFAPRARAIINAAGGHFLVAGGKIAPFDGEPPKRVAVSVWESMEKIQAWRANAEFQEVRKIGEKYAKFREFAVEGLPQ